MNQYSFQDLENNLYNSRSKEYRFDKLYTNFNYKKYERNIKCAGGNQPLYVKNIIEEVKPRLIIELGAYLGFSTGLISNYCKKLNLDFRIISVDTWTVNWHYGDVLKFKYGYPTIYYQYIANLHHLGIEKKVYPIPLPTSVAIQKPIKPALEKTNAQADIIYVDAGHDYFSVFADCTNYFPLLRKGGVMFGDDFKGSPGVEKGVTEFCRINNLTLSYDTVNWRINKL